MGVKIIIERKFKEPLKNEDIQLIESLRVPAIKQQGYISGETLIRRDNPSHVMVISSWTDLDSFNGWYNNDLRQIAAGRLGPLLEKPETVKTYLMGADAMERLFQAAGHNPDTGS